MYALFNTSSGFLILNNKKSWIEHLFSDKDKFIASITTSQMQPNINMRYLQKSCYAQKYCMGHASFLYGQIYLT